MITVYDRDGKIRGQLTNESPNGVPFWDDLHTINIETGVETFVFNVPLTTPMSQYLVGLNMVSFIDPDGDQVLFSIYNTQEVSSPEMDYITVSCESIATTEFNESITRPFSVASLNAAMVATLASTQWDYKNLTTRGLDTQFAQADYATTMAVLTSLRETYDVTMKFTCDSNRTEITNRVVLIMDSNLRENYGKYFIYEKDLVGVERTTDVTELATAVVAQGMTLPNGKRLNLTGFVPANSEPDFVKPITADYVYSQSSFATNARNAQHIFGLYTDSTAGSQQGLYNNAKAYLKTIMQPKVSYTMDVILLEGAIGLSGERVRVGDVIWAKDNAFDPPLGVEARVFELQRSMTNPESDTVSFGDYIPIDVTDSKAVERLKDSLGQLDSQLNDSNNVNFIVNADFRSQLASWEFPPATSFQTQSFPQATGLGEIQQYASIGNVTSKPVELVVSQEIRNPARFKDFSLAFSWFESTSGLTDGVVTSIDVTYTTQANTTAQISYSAGFISQGTSEWTRHGFLLDLPKLNAKTITSMVLNFTYKSGTQGLFNFTGTMLAAYTVNDEQAPVSLLRSSVRLLRDLRVAEIVNTPYTPVSSWRFGDPAMNGTDVASIISQSTSEVFIQAQQVKLVSDSYTLDNNGMVIRGNTFRIVENGIEQIASTAPNFIADTVVAGLVPAPTDGSTAYPALPPARNAPVVLDNGTREYTGRWFKTGTTSGNFVNARISTETPFPIGYSLVGGSATFGGNWFQSFRLMTDARFGGSTDLDIKSAKQLTVSFWVKRSRFSGTGNVSWRCWLQPVTNNAINGGAIKLVEGLATNTWQRVFYTWNNEVDPLIPSNATDLRLYYNSNGGELAGRFVVATGFQIVRDIYPAIFNPETSASSLMAGQSSAGDLKTWTVTQQGI